MYLPSMIIMSLAVAMTAAADFGVSMIVAPAYILSLKIPFLTFVFLYLTGSVAVFFRQHSTPNRLR